MTTDKSSVRILIYNDCGTEKFLNVFFPVSTYCASRDLIDYVIARIWYYFIRSVELEVNLFMADAVLNMTTQERTIVNIIVYQSTINVYLDV